MTENNQSPFLSANQQYENSFFGNEWKASMEEKVREMLANGSMVVVGTGSDKLIIISEKPSAKAVKIRASKG